MKPISPKNMVVGVGITLGVLAILSIIVPILMLFATFLRPPVSRAALEQSLKDIANESDTVPTFVTYGELHIGDETLHISQLCRKQNKPDYVQEIFCVADGKAYFVYTADAGAWTIASVDLESKVIQDHCTFSDTTETYRSEHYGEYSERMGFYHDGQIILSDFHSVFVYDITSGETTRYMYEVYSFPKQTVYATCADKTLKLYIRDSVHTFALEDMAAQSEGIAKIYALKDKKTWNEYSYLAGFLAHDTLEVVDDRVYYVGSLSNFEGEPYAIILEYDFDRAQWKYVAKFFVGSDVHRRCYVVPTS